MEFIKQLETLKAVCALPVNAEGVGALVGAVTLALEELDMAIPPTGAHTFSARNVMTGKLRYVSIDRQVTEREKCCGPNTYLVILVDCNALARKPQHRY